MSLSSKLMNPEKIVQFITKQILCDVTIKLIDSEQEKIIHAHKFVLATSSSYFETMFCSCFQESSATYLSIHVPDVQAAFDLIMSFYGQSINSAAYPLWRHELELTKCANYFGIERKLNYHLLIKQQIPTDSFAMFLTMCADLECDPSLIRFIYQNLPQSYHLMQLSPPLQQQMLLYGKTEYVILASVSQIFLFDLFTKTVIKSYPMRYTAAMCRSNGGHHIAIYTNNEAKEISILDVTNIPTITYTFNGTMENSGQSNYSTDNKQFAHTDNYNVIIRRTSDYQQVHTIPYVRHIAYLCYSTDNSMLAGVTSGKQCIIWQTAGWTIKYNIQINITPCVKGYSMRTMFFIDAEHILIRAHDGLLRVWDIINNKSIKTIDHIRTNVVPIYHLTNKKLVITNNLEIIDIDTGMVRNKLSYDNQLFKETARICVDTNDQIYIIDTDRCHIYNEHSKTYNTVLIADISEHIRHICYGCSTFDPDKKLID